LTVRGWIVRGRAASAGPEVEMAAGTIDRVRSDYIAEWGEPDAIPPLTPPTDDAVVGARSGPAGVAPVRRVSDVLRSDRRLAEVWPAGEPTF
jgi:hypothetical protein